VAVTVGVDIGTTSVKAVAADDEGTVLARARVPHPLHTPLANVLEHDAARAWRDGVRAAAGEVARAVVAAGHRVEAVQVAAMVPSLCPVDANGVPIGPGLLYGDERAKGGEPGLDPSRDGELLRMLRWLVSEHPDAAGYWPAQAVGIAALCGRGVIDPVTAMTAPPLFDLMTCDWDPSVSEAAGVAADRLPPVVPSDAVAGTVLQDLGADLAGAAVGTGAIDAFAEQLVAGADHDGDVLVILGATLIVWACVPNWVEVPGLWTVPHTAPGKTLVGGPSNAGGILRDWALRTLRHDDEGDPGPLDPTDVPVILPYLRGERTPLHDRDRRGWIHGLSVAHGPAAMWRAVREASGHSVRHHLELAGLLPPDGRPGPCGAVARRIVATGNGVRDRAWVQAIADVTNLPVDVVAVPEGGALGSAYLARVTAGLEADASGAGRWARVRERVEPDIAWTGPCSDRYRTFVELTGPPFDPGATGDGER
jgi:xylulokinase